MNLLTPFPPPPLSSDQGLQGDFTQQEPEAAAGGGAGPGQLHEQGPEGQRVRLQGVLAQQDRRHQVQHRQVRKRWAGVGGAGGAGCAGAGGGVFLVLVFFHASRVDVCVQERHSAELPDHHPAEEVPQGPGVPGGAAEHLRGGKSQVGGRTWSHAAAAGRTFFYNTDVMVFLAA